MNIPDHYQWNGKKILVVEDDESSAFLMGEFLRETGAMVSYRSDGEQAVAFMRKHPETDLILMDVLLPEMDGFTAAREIKTFARNVVIIAQTAYAFSVDHKQARHAGCDAFLTKPLVASVLLDMMDGYLA
ncbi:MAG: response regulator [Bacteroidetes bacterium]|nr:response regulator [Bacteroidota bacterium]